MVMSPHAMSALADNDLLMRGVLVLMRGSIKNQRAIVAEYTLEKNASVLWINGHVNAAWLRDRKIRLAVTP
jgi:hypothetical protein